MPALNAPLVLQTLAETETEISFKFAVRYREANELERGITALYIYIIGFSLSFLAEFCVNLRFQV